LERATRTIAILLYPGGQSLDISGPMEVFALATRQAQEQDPHSAPLYRLCFVARERGPVAMASGMQLIADRGLDDDEPIDTLLISGGMGDALDRARADRTLVAWVRAQASRVRRIGSICSGALLLAEAGVLDGRRATTHWLDVAELRRRYPRVQVEADAIYVHDGPVWSSAGITAGMDLALAMVAADHGRALALQVAKRMVMFTRRSGGQSQFSQMLHAQAAPDRFQELIAWLGANLQRPLDIEQLAAQVHMSPRHFRRRFQEAFGESPQRYLQRLRVDAAKALLEHTDHPLKRIAHDCGFASEEAMRRAFLREHGIRPGEYRQRFAVSVD